MSRTPLPARMISTALFVAALAQVGCAGGSKTSTFFTDPTSTTPTIADGRGMWFWESSAQKAIIASSAAQDTAIANFRTWKVTQVYGNYTGDIDSNPTKVRAWNAKPAANGIASYFLISTTSFFFPEYWPTAQSTLQTCFLDFNSASKAGEGFVGLAFDVEPQSFTGSTSHPSWGSATTAQRRVYMTDLLDMLQSSRSYLNSNNSSSAQLETYLTYQASSLTSTIGWADATDRNSWYNSLAQTVDRISVEEYGIPDTGTIVSQYEANDALLNGKSRISLNSAIGGVWKTETEFWSAVTATEALTGKFTDIEDYDTTTRP